jgi:uncharacterized protein
MKIELKNLKEEISSILFQLTPEELELSSEEASFVKPVEVELTLKRCGDSYFCSGIAKTEANIECSRCLESYSHPLRAKLDFLVKVEKDRIQIEYQDQAEPLVFPGNQFFSINNLVKEAILINLPLKPLCSDDCKGLCPMCGVNLNLSSCKCKREKLDPRWEKLKDLLKG